MQAPSTDNAYPTWASASKDMVGTSLGSARLWFTIAQGIITETYYPRIDIPQIRDLGFIIADDHGFWVELRRLDRYEIRLPQPGVPAVEIIHHHERFTFTLHICPSQQRDVLLLRCQLEGDAELRPYALLGARLGDDAENNLAYVGRHNGRRVLWAEQGPFGLALLSSAADGEDAWGRCSVGCLEASDGWQDFDRHGRMTWQYDTAGPGAVALMGELPAAATLALGFGTSKDSAATLAHSALLEDFESVWEQQCRSWDAWLGSDRLAGLSADMQRMLALSGMVLKVHQDRTYCGAAVASLSVPWGESSQSRGGYHLVWARDLVETAGAMVAMRAFEDARDVLRYLMATQQQDGHWLQNQWLGGKAFWQGIQLDEAAFPVLLASTLHACGELDAIPVRAMVQKALSFIAREGPATGQDRWEEDPGVNTFTLAIAIAALVEGSLFLDGEAHDFALHLADCWNARLEDWAYARGTKLAGQLGVEGYYIRTAPVDALVHEGALAEHVLIKNRAQDPDLPADEQIATDFLQLVRFGLRRPDDPCIVDTLRAVDALLKADTPSGPVWHRYNGDGYGERADGSPFDGAGIGRGWPLLTGERGHYALVAGEDVMPYLEAMMAMSGSGGLLPEQVWDAAPMPEKGLQPGRPSGSAMPLVWAHSEFIKLCYSRSLGYPVDRPPATWRRYGGRRPTIDYDIWGPRYRPRHVPAGNGLTIALQEPATVHWGVNDWQHVADLETHDTGLGVHAAQLPVTGMAAGTRIQFTFFWWQEQAWDAERYEVVLT
jgi:glucoamylase